MKLAEVQLRRIISKEIERSLSEKADKNMYSLRALFEDAPPKKSVNWESGYENFITALKRHPSSKKVNAFIAAGQLDGNQNDDKFKFSSTDIPVTDLTPMQNEIDASSTLRFLLKHPDKLKGYVKSDGPFSPAGKPIVVFNGKYIIDGHHRWSEVYCGNNEASINCINVQIAGLEPLEVLKAVQASIAVQSGEIPTESVAGINLFDISQEEFAAYVDEHLTDNFVTNIESDHAILTKLSKTGVNDDTMSLIKDYIWSNIEQLKSTSQPIDGAPSRDLMPQTSHVDWEKPLAAGLIDIVSPHAPNSAIEKASNQSEHKITKNQSIILERWHKIAGLI